MSTAGPVMIRPMRAPDVTDVIAVWAAAGLATRPAGRDTPAALRQQLEHYPRTWLVAEQGGRIVGVVLGTHDGRKGWINRVAVHPDHRRLGLARQLLAACEAALHAEGIGIVAALVEAHNEASAAFFRAAGYATDVPVHYFRKLSSPGV